VCRDDLFGVRYLSMNRFGSFVMNFFHLKFTLTCGSFVCLSGMSLVIVASCVF